MDLYLAGRVALVTGGGQGIGRQIALTLADEGCAVAVNDLLPGRAAAVAAEIVARGGRAAAAPADVTGRAAVGLMVESAAAALGPIDILVNNAGIAVPAEGETSSFEMQPFAVSDPARWERTMDVITLGVMNATHAVLPGMIERRYGKIVSIVSDAGVTGEPRLVAYSMAKAGVVGFSRALAKEVGRYRINVNCVSPGSTPKDESAQPGEAQLHLYPMGRGWERLGRASDVADPVVFLCSERAVWITGALIRASGGYAIA